MNSILFNLLFLAGGIAFLYLGALFLIKHSTSLAAHFKVPMFLIGASVLAIGTSLPELAVGVIGGAAHRGQLVIGNLIGSNIANISLVLALAVIVSPIFFSAKNYRLERLALIFAALLTLFLSVDGNLDRFDGIFLLISGLVFSVFLFHPKRRQKVTDVVEIPTGRKATPLIIDLLMVALGSAVLFAGAKFVVDGAVGLAALSSLSTLVIGLTIVAIGTSLPELATTITASLHKSNELLVGNIFGSNIFNLFLVLAVTAIINPIPVQTSVLFFDFSVLFLVTLFLLFTLSRTEKINWRHGAGLLVFYVFYLVASFFVH